MNPETETLLYEAIRDGNVEQIFFLWKQSRTSKALSAQVGALLKENWKSILLNSGLEEGPEPGNMEELMQLFDARTQESLVIECFQTGDFTRLTNTVEESMGTYYAEVITTCIHKLLAIERLYFDNKRPENIEKNYSAFVYTCTSKYADLEASAIWLRLFPAVSAVKYRGESMDKRRFNIFYINRL